MSDRVADASPIGKRLAMSMTIGIVWIVVLLATWALQPLSDSMIVGFNERPDGGFEAVVETTACNTLFASEARDPSAPLPDFAFGFDFPRSPCERPQSDARWAFALNVALAVVLLGAWLAAFRTWRTQR